MQELKPVGLPKMLAGFEDKTGYAQCIITYMSEELTEPVCFIGRTPVKYIINLNKLGQIFSSVFV